MLIEGSRVAARADGVAVEDCLCSRRTQRCRERVAQAALRVTAEGWNRMEDAKASRLGHIRAEPLPTLANGRKYVPPSARFEQPTLELERASAAQSCRNAWGETAERRGILEASVTVKRQAAHCTQYM
jgi:hypothetical protein